ncbi:MAG TPA: Nif3-like dinuclear metal center hexameric protein [Bryobacteraceae bacterium]|nr:Nif3-like dinuclear metal center hexameric protein [Bryobacteraceae bacterium]
MTTPNLSRRAFARLAGSLALVHAPIYGATSTAQDIAKLIQTSLGGEWPENGPDGFKAGKPETEVKGIATTAMATVDVLRQANKAGLNMVITLEPTFYGSRDGAAAPAFQGRGGAAGRGPGAAGEAGRGAAAGARGAAGAAAAGRGPGLAAAPDDAQIEKRDFIDSNGMVVFRLRQHWQDRKEGEMLTGLAAALGWTAHRVPGDAPFYDIPSASLADTVAAVRKKLNLRGGLRSVGDPKSKVKRVALCPGSIPIDTMLKYFDDVDLLLAGEVREWECVPYAVDMNTAGIPKSLVTVGRTMSEDPGMNACATWLKTVVKNIPVKWVAVSDPYWRAV